MTSLVERVGGALHALAPEQATCLVAVSGGPDSLALLDLLHRAAAIHQRPLVVGHVDHGIGADSATVAAAVERAAHQRGLPYCSVRLELGPATSETRARVARRNALRELALDSGARAIVLGHHADDQAETVLLRLLRGSGPAGLAGMAPRTGIWLRPMLGIERAALTQHLVEHGMSAWNDPANGDARHLRSWLRGALLPTIRGRLPDVVDRLIGAGRQAAEARRAWEAVPELLESLEFRADSRGISVAAPPLWGYRSEVRHALLQAVGRRLGVPLGARRLAAIATLRGLERGRIRLAERLEVELFDGRLTFQASGAAAPEAQPIVSGETARVGPARFTAREQSAQPPQRDAWETTLVTGSYRARAWQRGDRIRPLGGSGSRPVSVLLREARVPPSARCSWPVVTTQDGATIVWVPGICRADACRPEPGTKALHVECTVT
ncbi:MAG: tRNA lysidine(34) synthetase TilS [Gemmatimonadota bacterium]